MQVLEKPSKMALNPSQQQAVDHFCGPLLVVAGAGSGKTRALTHRIANLVINHRVRLNNVLAVTFTNKAAREMKERVGHLLAENERLCGTEPDQIEKRVQEYLKYLWIGTFHSVCVRILRMEVEKVPGTRWNKNFVIYDEADAKTLLSNLQKEMGIDDRDFPVKLLKSVISSAKNEGKNPQTVLDEARSPKQKTIAEVYYKYQLALQSNNAFDFDDLLLMTVCVFHRVPDALNYWHNRFKHILVDEYQDTNRVQYEMIRLLTTNSPVPGDYDLWEEDQRSLFVVGDADQSIYKFRGADFTILLNFQRDFGDGLPDDRTRTMVKLEENYRSTSTILNAANQLIENNSQRIDKVLRPTRGDGHPVYCYAATDEVREAHHVSNKIRNLAKELQLPWNKFAILYRTNAQSRSFEQAMVELNIPYTVVGGLRFYDRKEIKDAIAYLRLLVNPNDNVSLLRIINTPRRGIGKTTLEKLLQQSRAAELSIWEYITTPGNLGNDRAGKAIAGFIYLINGLRKDLENHEPAEFIKAMMIRTGYTEELKAEKSEEAQDRLNNIQELFNAIAQFQEENPTATISSFLESAALSSDLDGLEDDNIRVSLMTLHASKGLEFPVVFMVGMEQGLFPSSRSMGEIGGIEEERRLCYVGITRAQERLYLSYAHNRRLYGKSEGNDPSMFLSEIPIQ